MTEAAASGCGRGAGCDPPPPPPPQLPPPPAARAPTRTRTAGLSRAHPFLEQPSPPSSPQSAASRRAHARRPEACSRPLAPWAPPREPRADLRARLLQSDRARGAQRREHAGSGPTAPSTSAGGCPKPSFRYDNGRSEFRTFALGKVGQSPIFLALSSPWGLNLLPLPASPRRSDRLDLLSALHFRALCTPLLST